MLTIGENGPDTSKTISKFMGFRRRNNQEMDDTKTICTFVHTPELHALVEMHKDIVNSKYMTSSMYYNLLAVIEGTKKMHRSEDNPISLAKIHEFWRITRRKLAAFRPKYIKDTNYIIYYS